MPRGLAGAWLVGIGLLTWRGVTQYHKPVPAGRYAVASGLYALLALLANYEPAAGVATLTAWGFDLALLLKPGMLPGTSSGAEQPAAAAAGG